VLLRTLCGPPRPPLGSARVAELLVLGVREVGVRIEGARSRCPPVSSRLAPVILLPLLPLSSPVLLSLYLLSPLSLLLAISSLLVPSIQPHPVQAIRLDREWSPR
jgi:hypothetical protein